jgi:hypothetical protein
MVPTALKHDVLNGDQLTSSLAENSVWILKTDSTNERTFLLKALKACTTAT